MQGIIGGVHVAVMLAAACAILWSLPFAFHPNSYEVTSIPGLQGKVKSKVYSGHIGFQNNQKFYYYWFIEAEKDPENAPFLLWMQGGPGSSGMLGLFTEMGPYTFTTESLNHKPGEAPKVFYNPNSWTTFANMLFMESPVGVGNSYCKGPCPQNNDSSTAKDNYDFLVAFFEKFPRFKKNDFYITGESYGGIYVPTLSDLILKDKSFNLKGVAVGNGCTGMNTTGSCGQIDLYWYMRFLVDHGLISRQSNEALHSCFTSMWEQGKVNQACKTKVTAAMTETGLFDVYNVYDTCIQRKSPALDPNLLRKEFSWRHQQSTLSEIFATDSLRTIPRGGANDYGCDQELAMNLWFANEDVANAIHRTKDTSEFTYKWTEDSVYKYYKNLLAAGKKVLIFYGDVDMLVPYSAGEHWTTTAMDLEVKEAWRSWTIDNKTQTAGHVQTFNANFTYATVRGAGHMVPTFKPVEALVMIKNFIYDREFLKPHPPSSKGN